MIDLAQRFKIRPLTFYRFIKYISTNKAHMANKDNINDIPDGHRCHIAKHVTPSKSKSDIEHPAGQNQL